MNDHNLEEKSPNVIEQRPLVGCRRWVSFASFFMTCVCFLDVPNDRERDTCIGGLGQPISGCGLTVHVTCWRPPDLWAAIMK